MTQEMTGIELNLREMARNHWKEHRPKMYRELMKAGLLTEMVNEAARQTLEAWLELENQLKKKHPAPEGILEAIQYMNWIADTAWEMVREEWILLPTEEDQPNLGETITQ